jgi:hypothetical protein
MSLLLWCGEISPGVRWSWLVPTHAHAQRFEQPIHPGDLLDDLVHRLVGSSGIGLKQLLRALGLSADRRHRLSKLEDDRRPKVGDLCARHRPTIGAC